MRTAIPSSCSMFLILQHVLDIAPGSTEKLILIDVEMHDPARTHTVPKAPAVSRRIYKVVPTLVRQHILHLTHTAAYCEWHDQECIVFHNHELWYKQDLGPRQIEHGMYLRVIVPPPPSPQWEISPTIQAFHDAVACFDRPAAYHVAIASLEAPAESDASNNQGQRTRQAKSSENEEIIDIPMMLGPHVRMRRLRPEHDGSAEWLLNLGQIFSTQAVAETIDGDSFLYVLTWYIDHQRHTACRSPRPLRLDSASVAWIDEFRHLWRDLMDRRAVFSIYVVHPRPPQPRFQDYACHVLIEQNKLPGISAGVLTALLEGSNRDAMIQGAFSTPRFLRKQDLIGIMEIEHFCSGRRCTAYRHQEPIHLVVATEVESGYSIRLHIESPREQMPYAPQEHPNHFEDLSLMQTGSAIPQVVGHAIDMPPQTPECAPYQLDVHAAAFQPGQLFISGQSEFVQDLYAQWTQLAFSWEDEAMSTDVITWFVDHRQGQANCLSSRTVRLYPNYFDWERLIEQAWQDLIVEGLPLEFHFVLPHPPRLEHNTVGHGIVIQSPHDEWISSLVTVFDSFIGSRPEDFMRLVITTEEHVQHGRVAQACGYDSSHLICHIWIDEHHLPPGVLWPGRSGHNIVLQVHRQVMVLPRHMQAVQGLHMLQLAAKKQTDVPTKQFISLEDHVPMPSQQAVFVPVKLKHLVYDPALPNELFLADGYGSHDVEHELELLGHQRHVYVMQGTGIAVTVPIEWKQEPEVTHLIYCPVHDTAAETPDVILHGTSEPVDELFHMRTLHQHDFLRAVVISTQHLRKGLIQVNFRNNKPALEEHKQSTRQCSEWPPPQPNIRHSQIFKPDCPDRAGPTHCLSLGISYHDLIAFFQSASNVLCPWYRHLDLPPFVRQGIDHTATTEGIDFDATGFDRLLIYTDGSSKPSERRKPPLKVAEQGTPDAWAFAVVGEMYATDDHPGSLTLIGWQAQCVIYENDCNAYTGTDQIGAEFSEREALLFAGLWRLSLNSNIPTIFRTDSTTTADQASHELLRGTFQALQSSLEPDALDYSHVRGHAGDIWNELVDFLAKSEAAKSHNLHRQKLDLLKLKHAIPYFWMLFDQHAGLPNFTPHGFDVHPPNIPDLLPLLPHPKEQTATLQEIQVHLSLATLNVGSLFVGPDGFGGKLSFLRGQVKSHALNIVGIQEARSPAGMSAAEDVLRLAGGADKGKFGVELWISLVQPYGYQGNIPLHFKKSHFQVLHSDPRRLFVRLLNSHFDCFLIVLHAPQSGQPLPDRRQWWKETTELHDTICQHIQSYVMIDANAKTGPTCEPTVFQHDDSDSGNTEFFLEFLRHTGLCLPSTSDAHQGEHTTWTSPDGLTSHRIDYIAIPGQHLGRCILSQVLHNIDTGNSHADHNACALQLKWNAPSSAKHCARNNRAHDRDKIATSQQKLGSATVQIAPWDCDIEKQVVNLNSALHELLYTACPKRKDQPKKPYITAETWQIRIKKLALHKRLRQSRKQQRHDFLAVFFRSWAGSLDSEAQHKAFAHRVSVWCGHVALTSKHWDCARRLRHHLRQDKTASLNQVIADTGAQASAGTLLRALKPFIGSTNLKKQKKLGLPIVRQADGTLCRTPQEAQSRWIEFFADMEGGQRMPVEAYMEHWRHGLSQFATEEPIQLKVTDIPTLTELENAFRRVSPGKAVGMDAIPPELCHHCPSNMAKWCYAIMMKAALFGQESSTHKGGQMAIAWKHRGDVRDCTSHRSLLISSHVGKTIHRALWQKYHGFYTQYLQNQQLGGRPHMPVGIPLHITRAFLRRQARSSQPTAMIFLDLTEAFYRTLRPLAIGSELSDHCISLMCHRLGFDPDAMHELHALLQEPSARQHMSQEFSVRYIEILGLNLVTRLTLSGPRSVQGQAIRLLT